MSWTPQWQAAPPVVATPPVVNPALQYSTDQWTQMQQQNWQQWAQWQQQYQQWHQQYGAEYQKAMGGTTPAVAPTGMVNPPPILGAVAPIGAPPLPQETKPPLPPDEPPAPLPQQYQGYSTAPPPTKPNNYNTAPPDNKFINQDIKQYNTAPPEINKFNAATPINNQFFNKNNKGWNNQTQNMSNPPPSLLFINLNKPEQFENKSDNYANRGGAKQDNYGVKRPYINKNEFSEPKRNRFEQNWQTEPPAATVPEPASSNPEELSETEKKFMKQFTEWEAQFNKWKEQNQGHPDKTQYKEYEKKWETWRNQLLDRREQMRRKRLGITGDMQSPTNNKIADSPIQPTPNMPPNLTKPPPNINNEPLQFKPKEPDFTYQEDEENPFLKASTSTGIPGLDGAKNEGNDEDDKMEIIEATPIEEGIKLNVPDLDAISKNINSILGDQKLLSMLSMVTQNQNLNLISSSINSTAQINENALIPPLAPPSMQENSWSNDQNWNQNDDYQHNDQSNYYGDFNNGNNFNQPPPNLEQFGSGNNKFGDHKKRDFKSVDDNRDNFQNQNRDFKNQTNSGNSQKNKFGRVSRFDDPNSSGVGESFDNQGNLDSRGNFNNFGGSNQAGGSGYQKDGNFGDNKNQDNFQKGNNFKGPGFFDRHNSSDKFVPDKQQNRDFQQKGNFNSGDNYSNFDNYGDNQRNFDNEQYDEEYNDYNHQGDDYVEENYEEDNWQDPECYPSEDPFAEEEAQPMEIKPEIVEPIEEAIMLIDIVIDYDHKSKKIETVDIAVDPPLLFDYRHKAVNRIPLPQRPKWFLDAYRTNYPEFEPTLATLPTYSRYPPNDRFEYRSGRNAQSNSSGYERRNYDRHDDRRPSENKYRNEHDNRRNDDNRRSDDVSESSRNRNDRDKRRNDEAPESRYRNEHDNRRNDDAPKKFDDYERSRSPIRNFREAEKRVQNFHPSEMNSPAPVVKASEMNSLDDILSPPGRFNRPSRIVIILRGPPGSGKTFLAKLIKDKEVENGGSAPRILSLDDYFMVEQEKEVIEEGKTIKIKEMVYEYEECMEASYRVSLLKSFKKTITDGYFPFIIVDNVNEKVKFFGDMWSFAKQNGFQVYVCQLELDVQTCTKRNTHGRSEIEIDRIVAGWEPTPPHHTTLDVTTLVQSGSINEVEMEEINSPNENFDDFNEDDDKSEQACNSSKWDNFECSIDNLAKLDGISKPLRAAGTMEDYLQMDDECAASRSSKPGQKRVRWADLEERKEQEKMRAIGFVVGQTDWNRMMDPTQGERALTKTKYIERVNRFSKY